MVKILPKETTQTKHKKTKFRRGSLSHQKAIVCRGQLGSHVWELKKKKYQEDA
jgi:hypothetical protein